MWLRACYIFPNNTVHCIVWFQLRTLYKSRQAYIPSVYNRHYYLLKTKVLCLVCSIYGAVSSLCSGYIFYHFLLFLSGWNLWATLSTYISQRRTATTTTKTQHQWCTRTHRQKHSTAQHSTCMVIESNRIESDNALLWIVVT